MKKNLIVFISVLCVSFLFYGFYVSWRTYRQQARVYYESIESLSDSAVENLTRTFKIMSGSVIALSGSDSIKQWVQDTSLFLDSNREGSLNRSRLNREAQTILSNTTINSYEFFDYITISENGIMLAATYTKPASMNRMQTETRQCYKTIRDNPDYSLFLPPTEGNGGMYATLRIQSDFTTEDSLYIIACTREEVLKSSYRDMPFYDQAMICITDNDGVVFSSNNPELLGTRLAREAVTGGRTSADPAVPAKDTRSTIRVKLRINKDFWFLYQLPEHVLVAGTLAGMLPFITVTLLVLCIIIVTFIVVTRAAQNLIRSEYESRLLFKDAELRNLQKQMNPHFLFNTLLTVQIKAQMAGDEPVYQMISKLSALLRSGIYRDGRALVPLSQELQYVNYYLELQKIRFEDSLEYEVTVADPELEKCTIPRLLIEPLVENAVIHGAEGHDGVTKVTVRAERHDDRIWVQVSDNGCGFDVASVLEADGAENAGREKFGLYTIRERIALLYGEAGSFTVTSSPEGTTCTIIIPLSEADYV